MAETIWMIVNHELSMNCNYLHNIFNRIKYTEIWNIAPKIGNPFYIYINQHNNKTTLAYVHVSEMPVSLEGLSEGKFYKVWSDGTLFCVAAKY